MNAAMRRGVLLHWRSRNRQGVRTGYGRERMIFCSDRAAVLRRSAIYAKRFPKAASRDASLILATARDYLAEARYWHQLLNDREPFHVLHGTPLGAP